MANPTTNYGWPMPTSTDLVTDLPADFALFGQPVDTSLKALNPETTLGDIAYRSATSNTNTRLGIGSTSQILTVVAGVPAWATPAVAASGLTLIQRTSFSNVATTTTSFDGCFTSTYTQYIIRLEILYAGTNTDDVQIQYRYAGPSTQDATYYGSCNSSAYNTSALTYVGTNGAAELTLFPSIGDSSEPGGGQINVTNVGNSSQKPVLYGQYSNTATGLSGFFGGVQTTARTYTGFLLKSSSSNITGTVSVYGMAKS